MNVQKLNTIMSLALDVRWAAQDGCILLGSLKNVGWQFHRAQNSFGPAVAGAIMKPLLPQPG
jgi:hypothetical protein